ncbi:MAG: hypothetical protein BIFFINMI_03375 [Phycisphaerae bacterium]|nr:hypothetical protein [Phycisphaerae bacterium]
MTRLTTRMLVLALVLGGTLSGCKKDEQPVNKPADKTSDAKTPGGEQRLGSNGGEEPIGPGETGNAIDQKDDPDLAGIFPRSGQVGTWNKVTQASKYTGQAITEVQSADVLPILQDYGVDWVAATQYQLGNDQEQRLIVLLFHCDNSADAYGLMSISSSIPATLSEQLGQETRLFDQAVGLSIWTGDYCLRVYSPKRQPPTFRPEMVAMARQIVRNLPGTSGKLPPDLVRMLPNDGLLEGRVHYLRGGDSLSYQYVQQIGMLESFSKVLRMGRNDTVVVAAYRTPGLPDEPTMIFVVRYSNAADAEAAQQRLATLDPGTEIGREVVPYDRAVGLYVIGTLTGGPYSRLDKTATVDTVNDMPVFPTLARKLNH